MNDMPVAGERHRETPCEQGPEALGPSDPLIKHSAEPKLREADAEQDEEQGQGKKAPRGSLANVLIGDILQPHPQYAVLLVPIRAQSLKLLMKELINR